MSVKCGNRRVHGQSIVYHRDRCEVRACFNGFNPPPVTGVSTAAEPHPRYKGAVDAAWNEFCEQNEFFDGEAQVIRQAKQEFYARRGIMLSEADL